MTLSPACFPPRSIYIRENSIEYNQPTLQPAKSNDPVSTALCCGNSPTALVVRDGVSVVYFDDVLMDSVRDDTRPCHDCQTFCCGGRGEEVRLESRFCGDACYRGRWPGGAADGWCCCAPCVPVCCPECLCPCAARVREGFFCVANCARTCTCLKPLLASATSFVPEV